MYLDHFYNEIMKLYNEKHGPIIKWKSSPNDVNR